MNENKARIYYFPKFRRLSGDIETDIVEYLLSVPVELREVDPLWIRLNRIVNFKEKLGS
jgi:hypothetical protein